MNDENSIDSILDRLNSKNNDVIYETVIQVIFFIRNITYNVFKSNLDLDQYQVLF